MKQKTQDIILKQIILIAIIFISIFLASLVGQFINQYITYYGLYIYPVLLNTLSYSNMNVFEIALHVAFYFFIYIYLGFNFLVNIYYLSSLRYNYYYVFIVTYLFMLLPYNLEGTLATYLAYFLEPSEGLIIYYILIFPILLAIKATILMLGVGWLFKRFLGDKKIK